MDDEPDSGAAGDTSHPDNSFFQFFQLCKRLEKEPSYNAKTKLVSDFIKAGSSGGESMRSVPFSSQPKSLDIDFCWVTFLCSGTTEMLFKAQ